MAQNKMHMQSVDLNDYNKEMFKYLIQAGHTARYDFEIALLLDTGETKNVTERGDKMSLVWVFNKRPTQAAINNCSSWIWGAICMYKELK